MDLVWDVVLNLELLERESLLLLPFVVAHWKVWVRQYRILKVRELFQRLEQTIIDDLYPDGWGPRWSP